MEEENIYKAYDLLDEKRRLLHAINSATEASNWIDIIDAFSRARMDNFLGEFDIVKSSFISDVRKRISEIDAEVKSI